MNGRSKEKNKQGQLSAFSFYIRYSIMFLILMAGIYLTFLVMGRSFVWDLDGRQQYYQQMAYLGNYLREFFSGLLRGNFALRFYDFTIGLGEGIILAARLHRFDVLSGFFPLNMVSIVYSLVVLLRLYLSGVSFAMYCRYRKLEDRAIMIGVIVYLSSDFAMRRVPMHPFFGAAMIMLPLMFLGVEKILEEGKVTCLILAVAFGYLATYYYGYISTIAVGFYFVLRWPLSSCRLRISENRTRLFFKKLSAVVGSGALGILMVSWILIPIFSHLISSDRVQVEKAGNIPVLYPLRHMWYVILSFICPNIKPGYNTRLHFIALVIPVIIIVFFERIPKLASLRCALVIQTAGLCFPVVGFVMGAFGNISNRWVYILSFSLAYASVIAIQSGPVYRRETLHAIFIAMVLFTVLTVCIVVFGVIRKNGFYYCFNVLVGWFCLAVSTIAIIVINRRKLSYSMHCHALSLCALFSAVIMALVTFLPALGGMAAEFMKWDELPSYYEDGPESVLKEYTDDPFCRVDMGYYHKLLINNSLLFGYKGVSEYNSVMHAGLQHYMMELENPGIYSSIRIATMGGNAISENLASVQYYLADKNFQIIPYGFEKIREAETGEWVLYQNQLPLCFAYTYDKYIPYQQYQKLSAVEKEQALMSAVVLDEEDMKPDLEASFDQDSPEMREINIPVHTADVTADKNASITDHGYELGQNGTLTFSCQRRAGCEFYVKLNGVAYTGVNHETGSENLYVSDSLGTKHTIVRINEDPYYIPMNNRLIYMGYSDQDVEDKISICLGETGHCQIRGIELVYLPMDSFAAQIEKRNTGGCKAPQILTNQVEGDLEEGENRFVVMSVLYSKGWKAEVDGNPVPVMKANRCYIGFPVSEGAHHFKLTYTPPFFYIGIFVSVCAWIVFFVILVLQNIHHKRARRNNDWKED